MAQYGARKKGEKKRGYQPMQLAPEVDAASMYAALLARSNVETDQPRGLLERLWDNPLTEGLAGLLPGGTVGKGLIDSGAGPLGGAAKAAGLVDEGEDNPIYGPAAGGMNALFDLLSRGQYASANVVAALQGEDEDPDQSILSQLKDIWQVGATLPAQALPKGLAEMLVGQDEDVKLGDVAAAGLRGLAGREKTSFAQVLEAQGVENPALQHGAGFALDVALDPTTYLGLGKTKGASLIDEIRRGVKDELNRPITPKIVPDDVGKPHLKMLERGDDVIEAEILDADWLADHRGLPVAEDVFDVQMPPGGIRSEFRAGPNGVEEVRGIDRVVYNADGTYTRKHFDYDPGWTIGREIELADKPGVRVIVPDLRDPLPTSEVYDPFRMFDEIRELGPSKQGPNDFSLGPIELDAVPGTRKIDIRRQEDLARRLAEWARTNKGPQRRLPRYKGNPHKSLHQMGPIGSTGLDVVADAPIQAPPAKPLTTRQAPEWVSRGAYRMILQDRPQRPYRGAIGPGQRPVAALPPGNPLGELVEGLGRTDYQASRRGPIKATGPEGRKLPATRQDPRRVTYSSSVQPGKGGDLVKRGGELDTFDPKVDDARFRFTEDFDPGTLKGGSVKKPYGKDLLEDVDLLPKDNRGFLSVNVLGAPILRSYKAYEMGKKWLNPVLFNGAGEARMMYRMFSNNAVLPDGLDQLIRAKESARIDEMDGRINGVVETLKHITPEERRRLSFAIDEGENLSAMTAPPALAERGMETMEDVRQWIKGLYENLDAAERAQGVAPGERVSNYFYKVDRKGKPLDDKKSLQMLVDEGVDVETDVLQSVLHRIARAEARLTRSDVWIDAGNRYGISKSQVPKDMRRKFDLVDVPGQPDRLMPRQYVDALNHMEKFFSNDEYAAKMMQVYDTVLKEWKFLATAANPGHHFRNTVSDFIMNMQDGVVSGMPYQQAARVLRASRGSSLADEGMRGMYDYVPGQTVPRVFKETASGSDQTIKMGRSQVPLQDVWNGYIESGGKSSFQQTELHRTSEKIAHTGAYSAFRKKGGDIAQGREDYMRLAHFIDVMKKKGKRGKLYENGHFTQFGREAIEEAGRRVRKWNLDYGSLTPFERRYMKRLIPFYSFMRLNIPRQVELLVTKPGFMALYPKGQNLVQGFLGTDDADDTLLPDWIRETAPFRLQKLAQEQKGPLGWVLNQFGVKPGQQALFGGPGFFPIGDLERANPLFAHDPVKQGFNQLLQDVAPPIKIPIELGTGTQAFSGQEIGTGFDDYMKYFAGQIPMGRQSHAAITGEGGAGGFARYLTGLPIRGVSEGQMGGEFRRREDVVNAVFNKELNEAFDENPQLALLPEDERRRLFRMMQGLNTGR